MKEWSRNGPGMLEAKMTNKGETEKEEMIQWAHSKKKKTTKKNREKEREWEDY